MHPNLFTFATKELSQDAFLAWFIQWASPECHKRDVALNECATKFVLKLLSLQMEPPAKITSVKAGRGGWENIDVWAEINGKYLLIIEDKTFTGEHSNQLQRYKDAAAKWCVDNSSRLVCVYVKTGSESAANLAKIKQQGFAVFRRRDFLEVLNDSRVTNHIFNDFKEYLHGLEQAEAQFLKKPIKDWGDPEWKGFYQALEELRPIEKWDLVNPPNGESFWNCILNWHETKDCCPYMQIEQGLLAFKVGEVYENKSAIRDRYHGVLMGHCADKKEIRRPKRFGCGTYMTIGLVDRVNWLGDDDSIVVLDKVVARLSDYERLYSEMIAKLQHQNTETTQSQMT